ncbi:MAG: tyrosine--tRNA ligase [Chitinophagales bacterium]|nr:tyrosine--tRNA ligase [Bacteroidota bacterium]MCB9043678.1 tyrosine--tRNA ligase [Chitinophagales bacterium]
MKPKFNLFEELRWRGMLHDAMPDTEELLNNECVAGYIGIDPSSDSLHIGNLASLMILVHFQRAGHYPIALVGGATGMIGDPSGKSEERNLLSEDILAQNVEGIKRDLQKVLDFDNDINPAKLVNNYDWFKEISLLDFLRNVGKHLTISYMIAKDSVQNRLEKGISFTEFSYQLIQGYDFYWLWKNHQCRVQFGGSDQWGNITAGTELIRRMEGGEAFAFTCPLITKADGTKFGKTEKGAVFLNPERTSPYELYQFWINASDDDAKRYIRVFTLLPQAEILQLEQAHEEAPHLRILQKTTAAEVCRMVHGQAVLDKVLLTTEILFGKPTREILQQLSDAEILSVFEGVPTHEVAMLAKNSSLPVVDFLSESGIFPSRNEARRSLAQNAVSINMEKVDENYSLSHEDLLHQKYVLVQKGKKHKFLAIFV